MKLVYARHLIDGDGVPVVIGLTRTGEIHVLTGNPQKLVARFPVRMVSRLAQAIHDCEAYALMSGTDT